MFYKLMKQSSKKIRWATKKEDMFDHYDIVADETKYEVKTHKRLNRWDKNPSNIIWLEFVNVRGNEGWLYGKADFIAFLMEDRWWIVPRKDLASEATRLVRGTSKTNTKLYRGLYCRHDRPEECVMYVYPSDIKHLVVKEIDL